MISEYNEMSHETMKIDDTYKWGIVGQDTKIRIGLCIELQ